MRINKKDRFFIVIKEIIEKKCNFIGFSLGTILGVRFGKDILYLPPKINKRTNKLFTTYEYGFKIVCFWRVEHNNKILFTNEWFEGDNSTTILETKIKVLENKTVLDININKNTYDFYIDFEDNYRLTVINSINQFNKKHSELYTYCTYYDLFCIKTKDVIEYEKLSKDRMLLEDYLKSSNNSSLSQIEIL